MFLGDINELDLLMTDNTTQKTSRFSDSSVGHSHSVLSQDK